MFDTQSSKSYKSHLHFIMLLLKEPQKYKKKSKFFLRYKNMALKSRLQYLNSDKINKHYTRGWDRICWNNIVK